MPKDKEKLKAKAKRRRKSDNNQATVPRQNQQRPSSRIINDDGIAVSKQLARKMKTNRSFGRPRKHVNNNNNEPRICGNGKPMPSLADLEKMFNDTDDDAEECKVNNSTNTTSFYTNPVSCSTPKKTPTISEDKLKSPSTIKTIADKMLDFISNLPDATILLDRVPPPPVIPQRKRKKPDVPYIVGCKERAYVPSKPTTNFCKGDDDYGVDPNNVDSDDDDCSKPRAKKSKVSNISKSIFNAKSDEIAARLKECESEGSSDSNKTVAYEYYTPNNSVQLRSFSPLPSTSKDSETIHKNDIRFNESLIVEQLSSEEKENDLEIINQPLDTVVIDNETGSKKVQSMPDTSLIVIDDSSPPHMLNNDKLTENVLLSADDDSCIEIVEKKPSKIDDSPIIVEDYYSSLDFSIPNHSEFTEVIDVDDVIAESNAIIQKYCKNDLNSVTFVEPQANNIDNPSESRKKDASTVTDYVEPVIGVNEHHDTIINNTERNTLLTNHSPNMPSGNTYRGPTDSNYVHNISDIEYMPSNPRQGTSPVEFVSSTPSHNTSSVEYISTTLRTNNPPVHNVPQNEDSIENVVRNFFHLNSNDGHSNSALSQVNQQTSSCNSHNQPANAMCILSFLQSMSDQTRNHNSGSKKKNKKNTRNIQPQVVTPPPPPLLQTESQAPQTSKGLGDCPICMDSLATNPVASTICGHIFCMKCISAAVKSSGKRCPTCRKVLKGVGFHPLFL